MSLYDRIYGTTSKDIDPKDESSTQTQPFGASASIAFTKNPGKPYEVAVSMKSSDGDDFDRKVSGDDIDSLVTTLIDGLTKEVKSKRDDRKAERDKLTAQQDERNTKRNEINRQRNEINNQIDDLRAKLADFDTQLKALDSLDERAADDFDRLEDAFGGTDFETLCKSLEDVFRVIY